MTARNLSTTTAPPSYIPIAQFADRAGIDRRIVLRLMGEVGAATKIGRRWYTTRHWLRKLFPDAWQDYVNSWSSSSGNMPSSSGITGHHATANSSE